MSFDPVTTRYLRVQGINRTNAKNYSLREVTAHKGATGANLITPTMSTTERITGAVANQPKAAIDGELSTYWTAASTGGTAASDTDWWQVDLGTSTELDRVVLDWGTEPAAAYSLQTSSDGTTWTPVTYYGVPSAVSVFPRTEARYVRYQGVAPHAQYGYSIREIQVRDGEGETDLAQQPGVVPTASSVASGRKLTDALDKNFGTWWSVIAAERSRADSWYQLDLGAVKSMDRVSVYQEVTPVAYEVQLSTDGITWQTVDFQAPGAARVDNAVFDEPVTARYLRMQGEIGHPQYGYSMYEMQAFNGPSGSNLAAGKTASASSVDTSKPAALISDGKLATRWAVASTDRGAGDTWAQIDLGSEQTIDRARLLWESAGLSYYVQTSLDGEHWTNQYEFNAGSAVDSDGGWLTVDDRASFVVTGSDNPIRVVSGGAVSIDRITLSAGSAAGSSGMVVEGYAKTDAARAAQLAGRARATSSQDQVRVSDADGYLSLFNLGTVRTDTEVSVPAGSTRRLYQGSQTLGAQSTTLTVSVPAASSRVLPSLFTVSGDIAGLQAEVLNGRRLVLRADQTGRITLTPRTGAPMEVELVGGEQIVEFPSATRPYPLADLAAGATSYPSSPLPAGMSDPDQALDDDATTSWIPGSAAGRMVVDLGAETDLGLARVVWDDKAAPGAVLSGSLDGLTFTDIGPIAAGPISETSLNGQRVRYLALQVTDWEPTQAGVSTFAVYPSGTDPVQVADELQTTLVQADKAALQAAVTTASAVVEADYTTSSWASADLAALLVDAEAALTDAWAGQESVDAATAAITTALTTLVGRGDPAALGILIQATELLEGKLDGFTADSVSALETALSRAQAVKANPSDASQTQLDDAATDLQAALAGLTAKPAQVNKAVLQQVFDAASAMSNADHHFTATSWAQLTAARDTARTVLADPAATQPVIDTTLTELASAIADVTPAVKTEVLSQLISSASGLSNSGSRYTAATWSKLQSELATAKATLAAAASQSKVDAAVVSLGAAVAGLVPVTTPIQPALAVSKVKLNQSQLRLVKGKTLTLAEGVYYTNQHAAYSGLAKWKSSNTKVATVSSSGKVTAKKAGTTIITVTSSQPGTSGTKLSARLAVTVVKSKPKSKVTSVSASVPSSLKRGQVAYITGTYSSAKATGVKVSYRSSKQTVAVIDSVGRILAIGTGTTKITVKAGSKSRTYSIKVA